MAQDRIISLSNELTALRALRRALLNVQHEAAEAYISAVQDEALPKTDAELTPNQANIVEVFNGHIRAVQAAEVALEDRWLAVLTSDYTESFSIRHD